MTDSVSSNSVSEQEKALERLLKHSNGKVKKNINGTNRRSSPAVEYIKETSSEQRSTLVQELTTCILELIDDERAVYLENFGILVPGTRTEHTPRVIEDKLLVRDETSRTVTFEKCNDLVSYQREKYGKIVELHELTRRVYPRLPLSLQAYWSEQDTRRFIRGCLHYLKEEVVVQGSSALFAKVGYFYALHNRQGPGFQDWYAGADIFIRTQYQPLVKVGASKLVERPVFQSPWEVFEAAFGPELHTFDVNLPEELKKLDKDASLDADDSLANQNPVAVAVFDTKQTTRHGDRVLLYCTDGIRKLHRSPGATRKAGSEFIVQVAVDGDLIELPTWPLRIVTLGWLLLESSKSKTVRPGTGLSLGVSLTDKLDARLNTIYTTRFSKLPSEQLCTDGPYYYLNITGIFEDEAKILSSSSAEHLTALLEHRESDQILRVKRPSVVFKSGLLREEEDLARMT